MSNMEYRSGHSQPWRIQGSADCVGELAATLTASTFVAILRTSWTSLGHDLDVLVCEYRLSACVTKLRT